MAKKSPNPVVRALVEIGFIIFLFYSNLLMGEFIHSNNPNGKNLAIAIKDILTPETFSIALLSALSGYAIFEFLRKKF